MKRTEEVRFGIARIGIVPIRSKPSDTSEMVSQLIFGELCEVYSKNGKSWLRISSMIDNYVGWIDAKQIYPVLEKDVALYQDVHFRSLEYLNIASSSKKNIPIPMGAYLPHFDGMHFKMPFGKMLFTGQVIDVSRTLDQHDKILKLSKKFLGIPYVWGGKTINGLDCSGFVQLLFQLININLPRDAYMQISHGKVIDFIHEAQVGDLAYFQNNSGKVIHVGMMINKSQIIHASGFVRIDPIDQVGIYNNEMKKYTHKLRIVKRLLPDYSINP